MARKISMTVEDSLTIREGLDLFIRKCKVKNLTPNSIRSYEQKNQKFIEFIGGDSVEAASVDKFTVESYILYMKDKGDAGATINSYVSSLRSFLYFLMDNSFINRFKIELIKTEKKVKETYSEAELKLLLKKPNIKDVSFNEYKIWVLENYLLGTGNRISSVLEIKIKDVDFSNSVITLRRTKNRRQQIIPLAPALEQILKEYLNFRGGEADDYLFCNSFGEKANMRVTQQQVADYNNARGVVKTSCHLFRHTFAKMFILNGGDAFRLQKLLGHSDITITKEYVNMFSTDLAQGYEKFNPLENLVGGSRKKIVL